MYTYFVHICRNLFSYSLIDLFMYLHIYIYILERERDIYIYGFTIWILHQALRRAKLKGHLESSF